MGPQLQQAVFAGLSLHICNPLPERIGTAGSKRSEGHRTVWPMGAGRSSPSVGTGALVTVTRLPPARGRVGRALRASSRTSFTFGPGSARRWRPRGGMRPRRQEPLGPGVLSTKDRETEAAGGLRGRGHPCGLEPVASALSRAPVSDSGIVTPPALGWTERGRASRAAQPPRKCKNTAPELQKEVPRPKVVREEKPASRHQLPACHVPGPGL